MAYWTAPTGNTNASVSPLLNNSNNRYMGASPATGVASGHITSQPLFTTTPSLNDKTYYDWSEVNLGAMNRLTDRTLVARVQVQQVFYNTPRQTLVGSGDWAREDSRRYQRNIFGTAATNTLLVDVNSRLLDGSPNPFLGARMSDSTSRSRSGFPGAARPFARSSPTNSISRRRSHGSNGSVSTT